MVTPPVWQANTPHFQGLCAREPAYCSQIELFWGSEKQGITTRQVVAWDSMLQPLGGCSCSAGRSLGQMLRGSGLESWALAEDGMVDGAPPPPVNGSWFHYLQMNVDNWSAGTRSLGIPMCLVAQGQQEWAQNPWHSCASPMRQSVRSRIRKHSLDSLDTKMSVLACLP